MHVRPETSAMVHVADFVVFHEHYRGFVTDLHAHDQWQICIPLSGRSCVQASAGQYYIGPENGLAIPPDVPHSNLFFDGGYEYFCVMAPDAWLAEAFERLGAGEPDRARPWLFRVPFLWALGRQLATEVDVPGPGFEPLVLAGLEQLRVCLVRSRLASEPASGRGEEQDARILRAIDTILRDYGEELTIEGLAAAAALTPRHFERLFKQALGVSPKRYLIDVRMMAARHLLESTDLPVIDVAAEVGFNLAAHFVSTFHRSVGTTPAAYRRAARET